MKSFLHSHLSRFAFSNISRNRHIRLVVLRDCGFFSLPSICCYLIASYQIFWSNKKWVGGGGGGEVYKSVMFLTHRCFIDYHCLDCVCVSFVSKVKSTLTFFIWTFVITCVSECVCESVVLNIWAIKDAIALDLHGPIGVDRRLTIHFNLRRIFWSISM